MKKLTVILCAALACFSIGCGTSSTPQALTYIARGPSDSYAPHMFTLDTKTGKSTAVSISIPANAQYVSANRAGNKAVYSLNGASGWDIFSMGLDNKETQLTTAANAYAPVFSPDGKTIAYSASTSAKNYQIYTMNADGTNQKALYPTDPGLMYQGLPQFSPDGKTLAFYISVYAQSGVQSGAGAVPGTHAPRLQSHNRGEQALHGNVHSQSGAPTTSGLYIMALTDTTPTLVYETTNYWGPATFSADGKKLLMTIYDGVQDNISSINLDGSGLTALTTSTDAANFAPVAFGNLILFNRYNYSNSAADLYTMDTAGANQTLVSTSPDSTWQTLVDTYWSND